MNICLVGHNGNVLLGRGSGGSEKQIALLARNLAKRGHHVTLVTTGEPYLDTCVDGVFLRRAWELNRGLPKIRFFTYRLPALRRLLTEISADLYYSRGLYYITPTIINSARSTGAFSAISLIHDKDLDPSSVSSSFAIRNSTLSRIVEPIIHCYFQHSVFPQVGCFLAQNEDQAEVCRKKGLRFQIIPSIVEPPSQEVIELPEEFDVAWVGNITRDGRRFKRLDKLLELTQLLPNASFAVIGRLTGSSIQPLVSNLKMQPNVTLLGSLPNSEVIRAMAGSRIVINTSVSEGFSNVMLEAWSLGKPTLTLSVNPNNLLGPDGLGYCAHGEIHQMAEALCSLLANKDELRAMGVRCRSYVKDRHYPESVCKLFEKLIVSNKIAIE